MAFMLLYWTGMRIGELLALTYVCKLAKEKQAVVIAAHIDDYCSISSMRPQLLQQLLEGDYLDAVQVVNSVVWDKFASDKGFKIKAIESCATYLQQ